MGLMELGKGNYCSPYYYKCNDHEPIVRRCFYGFFDPVRKTCTRDWVNHCEMDDWEISEWNKPCQTDYLKFNFNANETRHHFCDEPYFDPTSTNCVPLDETECSQDHCDYYWHNMEPCKPDFTTTEPSTHPSTHPTTDATTRPTTPTVLTTTVEPDDDFVCPNGG